MKRAEARKSYTGVDPPSGEKLQAVLEGLVRAPKPVIARARALAKP